MVQALVGFSEYEGSACSQLNGPFSCQLDLAGFYEFQPCCLSYGIVHLYSPTETSLTETFPLGFIVGIEVLHQMNLGATYTLLKENYYRSTNRSDNV